MQQATYTKTIIKQSLAKMQNNPDSQFLYC